MSRGDCAEKPGKSYGASFYVYRDDATPNGVDVADLDTVNQKWRTYGVLRALVEQAEVHGVYFAYSPQDCPAFPTIAHAHVTLVWPAGFDSEVRTKLLKLLEADVVREPTPPDPLSAT